jgi:hypothetical protein
MHYNLTNLNNNNKPHEYNKQRDKEKMDQMFRHFRSHNSVSMTLDVTHSEYYNVNTLVNCLSSYVEF